MHCSLVLQTWILDWRLRVVVVPGCLQQTMRTENKKQNSGKEMANTQTTIERTMVAVKQSNSGQIMGKLQQQQQNTNTKATNTLCIKRKIKTQRQKENTPYAGFVVSVAHVVVLAVLAPFAQSEQTGM